MYIDYEKLKTLPYFVRETTMTERYKKQVKLNIADDRGYFFNYINSDEVNNLLSDVKLLYLKHQEIKEIPLATEYSIYGIAGIMYNFIDFEEFLELLYSDNSNYNIFKELESIYRKIPDYSTVLTDKDILEVWKKVTPNYKSSDYDLKILKQILDYISTDFTTDTLIKGVVINYLIHYFKPFKENNTFIALFLQSHYMYYNGYSHIKNIPLSYAIYIDFYNFMKNIDRCNNYFNDITFIIIYILERLKETLDFVCSGKYEPISVSPIFTNNQIDFLGLLKKGKSLGLKDYMLIYNLEKKIAEYDIRKLLKYGFIKVNKKTDGSIVYIYWK